MYEEWKKQIHRLSKICLGFFFKDNCPNIYTLSDAIAFIYMPFCLWARRHINAVLPECSKIIRAYRV